MKDKNKTSFNEKVPGKSTAFMHKLNILVCFQHLPKITLNLLKDFKVEKALMLVKLAF